MLDVPDGCDTAFICRDYRRELALGKTLGDPRKEGALWGAIHKLWARCGRPNQADGPCYTLIALDALEVIVPDPQGVRDRVKVSKGNAFLFMEPEELEGGDEKVSRSASSPE
jgi:hypothetical protein